MSALDQINAYMARLEARFRWLLWSRGLAVAAGAALAITILLAVILRLLGFMGGAVVSGRTLLFLGVALAIAFGLAVPLLQLNRRWAARRAESQWPGFQERLLTLVERQGSPGPLSELLAEDALPGARENEPEKLVPSGWIIALATSAGAAVTILLWLVFAGPGFLGYGSALLWGNTPRTDLYPARTILVQPGNLTLRRKAGLQVTARLIGFSAPSVRLLARYRNTPKWDAIPMQPEPGGGRYQFLIAGVDDTLDYYVEAGSVRSKTYTLMVRDLPVMKALRVRYHYPPALGLADTVEDPGGDLRAVQGTQAELSIETDRPLSNGAIVLDTGARIPLESTSATAFTARVPILKDGSYSVGAIDAGENVRLSDDYFIEARRDAPPSVKVVFPARDTSVSPIEEMTVKVEAEDDYGLKDTSLHYSVNGGDEKTVSLMPRAAAKKLDGKTTLYLEDFKLSPGDVVSYYASARDANVTAKTDIYFASAQPFDLRFSQAQAGGGGMGDDDPQFSEREKEIIGATWNEIKNPKAETAAAEARFLSDMQAKLSDQAHSLAERIRARNIDNSSPEFKAFTEYMDKASASMKAATDHLRPGRWNDAMPAEQKSLQALLRAEAAFRDIRVAFGSQGAGGSGGGATSARDLERLLDLELDTQKNQYETEQAGTKSEESKKLDDALQKLKDLAKRQQELAAQQQKADQQFSQRWEQEMLRREAEDLRRQLEDAQQQQSQRSQQQGSQQSQSSQSGSQSSSQQSGQQGQQSQSQQGQQANSSSSSSSGAPGSRSGRMSMESSSQFESAMRDIEQAEEQMRAGNSGDPDAARRASERLREAEASIEGARQQASARQFGDLERKATELARAHQALADSMRQQFAGSSGEKEQDDPRFGPAPSKSTPQSRQLAQREEHLAEELKALRQEMADLSKNLSAEQPEASSKLKQAIGEVDESDLEMRMRKSAEWMRKGEGMYSWMREGTTSMGLDKLRDEVQQAGAALRKGDQTAAQAAGSKDAETKRMEAALGEVQQMRKSLEQLRAGNSPDGRRIEEQAQQGAGRIRESVDGLTGIGVTQDVQELMGSVRQLSGGDPRELKDRLDRDVLPTLDRMEIELRRRLDEQLAEDVRTAAPENAPDGYADAVAEYFRRLSKTR